MGCSEVNINYYQIGRGFPATWGFVIAAIFAVILIRLLVFREQRSNARGASTEVMAVEYAEEGGSNDRYTVKDSKAGNSDTLAP